ncbi:MAG: DUF4397 domain-containing protein [Bacteroidia bacterium]|nr:DUF4397 domain-containing protein [Bacteroidia bacterium]
MKSGRFLYFLLLIVIAFSSCKKDDYTPIDRGNSYLHIVSGAKADTFNVVFDYLNADTRVIAGFYENRNWPLTGYADLEAGGTPDEYGNGKIYLLAIRDSFLHNLYDTLMYKRPIELQEGKKSSVCFADSGGMLAMAFFSDEVSTPAATSATVRFINLKEAIPSGGLRSTDTSINLTADFLKASSFVTIPAGTYDLEALDGSGGVVTSRNNVTFGGGGIFSIYHNGNSIEFYRH